MTKLYKAVDKLDGMMSCFLVNNQGVAISDYCRSDDSEIKMHKECENGFIYRSIEEFKERAIDPVLIAEW
nr:MAG TPA: hypothetical protein [Caudoviricetes sp.]